MAEEAEGQYPGAEAAVSGVDPAAVALALGGASRDRADAFLKKQEALIDDQRHHLHEQFKQLRLNIWQQRMGVLLRAATAVMGIAVAAGLALIVWNAASSNGLIIEPFSVPPDMANNGVNGQMLASQMVDKLNAMSAASNSYRPPRSFTNNWGDDVKVEIPDTGVSLGEAYRFLRDWLGHDTHISGEVYRTPGGITMTVRASDEAAGSFSGTGNDLDGLVQKAAEHVYGSTQPYRYAGYLRTLQRFDEARPIYVRLTQEGSQLERSWAWIGLATLELNPNIGDNAAGMTDIHRSIAITPNYTFGYYYLGNQETALGHSEAALTARHEADRLLNRESIADINSDYVPSMRLWIGYWTAFYLGDYTAAAGLANQSADLSIIDVNNSRDGFRGSAAMALALAHDPEGAERALAEMPHSTSATATTISRNIANTLLVLAPLMIAAAKGDWNGLLALQVDTERSVGQGNSRLLALMDLTILKPLFALAKAKLGDAPGAEQLIKDTPGDCYDCLRMRGTIAALAGEPEQADFWFARAVTAGPSLPQAEADWGEALLDRDQPDAAIAKFTIANQKGPHFADPLEMWGEALMKKNRSDLALAKFTEAEKYAPNWGRLHTKWGEALGYAGKKDEAQKQFALAAGLDMSDADKAEWRR